MLGAYKAAFPGKEGGIQVLAGQALSSQRVWLLIENPEKLSKCEFGKFTSMEKFIPLHLIKFEIRPQNL
jgi:hypothetical protein